jgi:glutaminyl-tRNA synthetase
LDLRLKNVDQINAALSYADALKGPWVNETFEEAAGVGIIVTRDQVKEAVLRISKEKLSDINAKRYSFLGSFLGLVKQELRWANSLDVKEEVSDRLLALLGPKDERDDAKKKKKEKSASKADVLSARNIVEMAKSFKFIHEGELARLHKPGENPQIEPSLMEEHLAATGGKVVTRFPPEPNGFLHIGHAKAININFAYAQAYKGETYLRYDDTNPEAEEEEYFVAIKDTVEWLGFKPHKITYSSDYFGKLYELAIQLIKVDKAYVCHCTGEEIFAGRGGENKGPRHECSHRSRPIKESLEEFVKMKEGLYKEGEAILRMKMDMQNPSPQFWDLVAYRVLFSHHVRSGDEWCIYPTYDYTHCLVDSFENITHSLCTTEFVMSRPSYYWLVDALEVYKPVQWEYGRLNLTNTVLSKRKLMKLVDEKIVSGWDDPRLYTLSAVRRRGFTPEAINAFVRDLGVTTSNTVIEVERLEGFLRDHLNAIAPRYMLVLDPIKVVIQNLPVDHLEMFEMSNKPKGENTESHEIPFTNTIYIDRSDFKEEDNDPNFFRLCIGKSVGLLHVPRPIKATSMRKDEKTGEITVFAHYEVDGEFVKPKTYIQWVASAPSLGSPLNIETRLYSNLFLHSNPLSKEEVPGGWMSDINPDSLVVMKAYGEIGLKKLKVEDKFQALRVGYFCLDKDSALEKGKIVINRTVTLKEDSKKGK